MAADELAGLLEPLNSALNSDAQRLLAALRRALRGQEKAESVRSFPRRAALPGED